MRRDMQKRVNPRPHKQSKYLTIILVPYSANKTSSIKIPYWCLYTPLLLIIAILLMAGGYVVRDHYYQATLDEMAAQVDHSLQQWQELDMQLETSELSFEEMRQYYDNKYAQLERIVIELQGERRAIYNELKNITYLPAINESVFLGATPPAPAEELALFDEVSLKTGHELTTYRQIRQEVEALHPYLHNYPTVWPVKGTVSSEFGSRSDAYGGDGQEIHSGIDICVPSGTAVQATGGGTVAFAGMRDNYGYLVIIDHGLGLETYYAHNSRLLVSAGDTVSRNQAIADSGNTGRSTGAHVHYEVRVGGIAVNPRKYLP